MFVFAILDPEWLTGCLGETVGQSNKERKSLFKDFPLFCFKEKISWTLLSKIFPFYAKKTNILDAFSKISPFYAKKRKNLLAKIHLKSSFLAEKERQLLAQIVLFCLRPKKILELLLGTSLIYILMKYGSDQGDFENITR